MIEEMFTSKPGPHNKRFYLVKIKKELLVLFS